MAAMIRSEAEKMRRVPGIFFADSPTGRHARIAGTGLDVWKFIQAYRICGNDRTQFGETFDALTPEQLNAAFTYYELFPEEIDERLACETEIAPKHLQAWISSLILS
jgi:uncharacterized protein (DUF433 family)